MIAIELDEAAEQISISKDLTYKKANLYFLDN